jgi:hypothetical protein
VSRVEREYTSSFPIFDSSHGVRIHSSFDVSGTVSAHGGTDAEASNWKAGFIQNVISDNTTARYSTEHSQCFDMFQQPLNNVLDSDGFDPPWYTVTGRQSFSRTNSDLSMTTNDSPEVKWGWMNRCVNDAPKESKDDFISKWGELKETSGSYKLATWLVAKHKSIKEPRYLNYAIWEVDFSVVYGAKPEDYKSTGGAKVIEQGKLDGQLPGPVTPKLDGKVFNYLRGKGALYECSIKNRCGGTPQPGKKRVIKNSLRA